MASYIYEKDQVNADTLSLTIKNSSIGAGYQHIEIFGIQLTVFFSNDLSPEDKTALDNLVASHSGIPTVDTSFIEVSSIKVTQINSSTYTAIEGMTSPRLQAGKYMAMFSGSFGSTAPLLTTPGIRLCIFSNGVQVRASEVIHDSTQLGIFGSSPIGIATSCSVTVEEGQVVDVRWRNNGSGNTVTSYNRILNLMRIE